MDATHDSDEARFFTQRGFGLDLGFGERPALLAIDFMVAFSDASLPLGANLDVQIAATNQLLDVAHARNMPVFFSKVAYDEPDCADAGIWGSKMTGLHGLTADSPVVELDARLHRIASDGRVREKIRIVLLRHRSRLASDRAPHRHADHHRLHDERLRARFGRRCDPIRLPAGRGA